MRRAVRRQAVGVALFPFLAVLICTMGSLIVLLVLLVQQARLDARSIAAEQVGAVPPDDQQLRQQLEEAQWKRELLEQSRAEKTKELADSRVKLAHLEDHIQRLATRARDLMERAKAIDEGQQLQDNQLAAAQAELARLQQEIAKKQAELDETRKRLQAQEQWFALIPYEGPHGTRRRPIYIECTAEGVIIQPEGLVFSPDDFNGPLGPHNPLDAALRTIREHLNATARGTGEPYPLLVVRPSGIVAYGAARAALKDWDEEFGYELVGDDKKLAFGSPDPALSGLLQKSVAVARRRQAAMAAMMPRRFQGEEPLTSFSPDSLAGGAGTGASPGGRGAGTGRGSTGASGGSSPAGSLGTSPGNLAAGGHSRSAISEGTGSAFKGAAGTRYFGSLGSGTGTGGTSNPGTGGNGSGATSGNANPAGNSMAGGAAGNAAPGGTSRPQGPYSTGSSGQSASAASGPQGSTSVRGAAAAVGSAAGPSAGQSMAGANSPSEGQPGSGGASFQLGSPGQPAHGNRSASATSAAAAAQGRGRDWALPGSSRHATAITRPIHVAVLADRLVLVPERGADRVPMHLRVSDQMTVEEIDAFVTAVQREMKSWGLAVRNGYWKPVLQVEVAPDSEHHFADLQQSLSNSGFEIQRKQP